ncbi:hypothetical protein [Vogesella indigofera]|uniref:hypothetical protein n=1 Tax=Vogesella indigofera TaxID=45465 RepID=UPI00234F5674|nr:hypothetical protein [Vogesella indigofera]MDC7699431.1 hypothetical protein [Vogesella indigofera]MDC7708560.1 hypothetical protein [Vogesella indigofera]
MKNILLATAIAAVTIIATPALAADVGVSISIGQPGFYGRLDIGGYPPPRVLYREPIAIRRVPVARPPIYLRVPPGHARNWGRHCRSYNACGERVYFVQDRWYNNEYVPRYQRYQRDRQHQRRHHSYQQGDNWDHRYEQQGIPPLYNRNSDDQDGNDGYQNR